VSNGRQVVAQEQQLQILHWCPQSRQLSTRPSIIIRQLPTTFGPRDRHSTATDRRLHYYLTEVEILTSLVCQEKSITRALDWNTIAQQFNLQCCSGRFRGANALQCKWRKMEGDKAAKVSPISTTHNQVEEVRLANGCVSSSVTTLARTTFATL